MKISYRGKYLFTLILAVLVWASSHSQPKMRTYLEDIKAGPREKNFDTQHLLLEVAFEPEKGLVKGKVTLSFIALQQETDTLFLDAPGIRFKTVQLDRSPVDYALKNNGIVIKPPSALKWDSKHQLFMEYEAQPRKGIYFIGWNQPEPANLNPFTVRRQIWSQGQGIDNRHWIPCFDDMNDKLISEVKVTFDKNYRVLSNGTLVSEKKSPDGNNKLWHYRMSHPHAPYLIMVAIGKYDVSPLRTNSGVVIDCWYYPEYPERVAPTYRYSSAMMDWMEKEFGVPYPWGKKYSQIPVQDFIYGAMENTTATVFGDFYFMDERAYLDRNYVGTNAHELAHQWFGDYVTARGAEDTWLQESFATHYQKHFERSIFGDDYFQWNRRQELQSVLDAARRDNNPIAFTSAGSERVYQKGSLVLDMLKYLVGTDQFNRALAYYLKKHPYQNVDTHDFYLAFLETLGNNFDWFFDQWLYRGGEPEYEVRFEELAGSEGEKFSRFTVKQVHETNALVGLFKMPVWLEVYYTDGSSDRKQEWISLQTHTIDIANPQGKKVDYALFDPNSEIIKTVDFPKSLAMLKSQALKAKNMIDRYDALVALSGYPYGEKNEILQQVYDNEQFFAVRAEAAKQLIAHAAEAGTPVIKKLLHDTSSRVRLAVVQNIEKIPDELLADFETLLSDSSYAVVENVLVMLCDAYPDSIPKYLAATANVLGMGSSVKVRWLEMGCRLDKEKYLPQLVELTGPLYEFRTRNNAMEALKRLNHLDEKAIVHLFDASCSPNRRLAGPAKALLKHFMIQTEYKKMIEAYYAGNAWHDWQLDIWKDLF
ncbi:MAG TPA: M1 family metallopeptidase [Chitinophagales bacterium]|nr:M1 family metallopeptidase [Chitinophagales bacterium]